MDADGHSFCDTARAPLQCRMLTVHESTELRGLSCFSNDQRYNLRIEKITTHESAGVVVEYLGLHCLRHCYLTHLIEASCDPAFVQMQVGHSYASTTGLYTSVSSDFKQKTVQQMIARRITNLEDPDA